MAINLTKLTQFPPVHKSPLRYPPSFPLLNLTLAAQDRECKSPSLYCTYCYLAVIICLVGVKEENSQFIMDSEYEVEKMTNSVTAIYFVGTKYLSVLCTESSPPYSVLHSSLT